MADTATAVPTAEGSAAPAQTQQTTEKPAEQLLAGKYKDAGALQQGVRELYKTTGLAELPDGELVGEGKFFKTVQDAEKAYKRAESLIGKPKEPAAPKPDTVMFPKTEEPVTAIVDENVDIAKVVEKAGFTKHELYRLFKSNSVTENILGKLRESHPEYSKLGPKAGNRAVLNDMKVEFGTVAEQERLAAQAVGGVETLSRLGSNWTEYVPPERHAAIAKLMDDHNTFVEAALLLKQYYEVKYGNGGSGPKPVSGSAPSPTTAEQVAKAKQEAAARIAAGQGTPADFAVFKGAKK